MDFGIAKVLAQEALRTATHIGTPAYSAPEQLGSLVRKLAEKQGIHVAIGVSPATDIWALGLIVYEALTGLDATHYWNIEVAAELPIRVATESIEPASSRAGDRSRNLPTGFDAWFQRCLEKDASARWQTIHEAVSELTRLLGESAPNIGRTELPWSRAELSATSPLGPLTPMTEPLPPAHEIEANPHEVTVLAPGLQSLVAPAREISIPPKGIQSAAFEVLAERHEHDALLTLRKHQWKNFFRHLGLYALVNGLFVTLNLLTTHYPWALFPAFGWGVALVSHFMYVAAPSRQKLERQLERQRDRERRRQVEQRIRPLQAVERPAPGEIVIPQAPPRVRAKPWRLTPIRTAFFVLLMIVTMVAGLKWWQRHLMEASDVQSLCEYGGDKLGRPEACEKACDDGHMSSCRTLGSFYLSGMDVAQDQLHGLRLYERACDGGDSFACNTLGDIYYNGVLCHNSTEPNSRGFPIIVVQNSA